MELDEKPRVIGSTGTDSKKPSRLATLEPMLEHSEPSSNDPPVVEHKIENTPPSLDYTILVQLIESTDEYAAIEYIKKACTRCHARHRSAREKLWFAVSFAALAFHKCEQATIDAACDAAGIGKGHRTRGGGRPIRPFARLAFGLKDDRSFSTEQRNVNDKEVGRYARYIKKCLAVLESIPMDFKGDPVEILVKEIKAHNSLERFVKGDDDSSEERVLVEPNEHGKSDEPAKLDDPRASRVDESSEIGEPVPTTIHMGLSRNSSVASAPAKAFAAKVIPNSEKDYGAPVNEKGVSDTKAEGDLAEDDVGGTVGSSAEEIAKEKSNVWLARFKENMRNTPNRQRITLANPPSDLCNMPALLLGEYKNGDFIQWTATNFRPYMSEAIWNIANNSPHLASDCVRAIADAVRTGMIPDFLLGEEKVWKAHHHETKSKFCLSLASDDTFLFSTPNSPSSPVTKIQVKRPVISDAFTPLCLNTASFAEVVDWYHDCIGQTFADDILSPPSSGNPLSRELTVDWCFRSDILSFEPFAQGAQQADFGFASFEPEFEATVHTPALLGLFYEFVRPWIRAVSTRQQSKRSNTKILELHLGSKFGFEFNQSPGGRGERFDLPSVVFKEPVQSIDLAFLYADLMPVLAFLSVTPNLTARTFANHDGVLFIVDLGYADCSMYVPALTNDRKQTRNVLFTQFP